MAGTPASAHDSSVSLSDPTESTPPLPAAANHSGGNGNTNEDGDYEMDFTDADSAMGGSLVGCDTQSIASFVTDYRYENGRRYHAHIFQGEYWVIAPHLSCQQGLTYEGTER